MQDRRKPGVATPERPNPANPASDTPDHDGIEIDNAIERPQEGDPGEPGGALGPLYRQHDEPVRRRYSLHMTDLVIVARFASRPEAVVAQSLLRSEGIDTLMPDFNALLADYDPSMMEHGWRLLAHAEDAEDAQTILREAQFGS